jgi:hypothetical protein
MNLPKTIKLFPVFISKLIYLKDSNQAGHRHTNSGPHEAAWLAACIATHGFPRYSSTAQDFEKSETGILVPNGYIRV